MTNKEVYLEEFEVWFRDIQGKPYDSMYYFARDAWLSACQLQEEKISLLEKGLCFSELSSNSIKVCEDEEHY